MVAFATMIAGLQVMKSSTEILSGALGGIQSVITGIGSAFTTVFNAAVALATKVGKRIKKFYDEHLSDAFQSLLKGAKSVVVLLFDVFRKVVSKIVDVVKEIPDAFNKGLEMAVDAVSKIPSVLGNLKDLMFDKLGDLKDFIFGIPESIGNMIGNVVDRIGGFIGRVVDKLGGFKDRAMGLFGTIGDALMKPFEAVWSIISKIIDGIKNVISGFVDKVGGFFGGGKKDDATPAAAASTVSKSITYNRFAITVNLNGSGLSTREQARDLADLLQQEIARKTGGSTQAGRYA